MGEPCIRHRTKAVCKNEDVREGLLIVSVSPRTRLILRGLRDILGKVCQARSRPKRGRDEEKQP